jgi:hypothetical protein
MPIRRIALADQSVRDGKPLKRVNRIFPYLLLAKLSYVLETHRMSTESLCYPSRLSRDGISLFFSHACKSLQQSVKELQYRRVC